MRRAKQGARGGESLRRVHRATTGGGGCQHRLLVGGEQPRLGRQLGESTVYASRVVGLVMQARELV